VSPTPWRVPQYWALVVSGTLLGVWVALDLPYLGVVFGLYSVALVLVGRQIERDSQVHRKLQATVRQRPIPVPAAHTELHMRVIPSAHLPAPPGAPRAVVLPPVPRSVRH
jgi:hypothetical protein